MTEGLVVRECRDLHDIEAIEATMPTGRNEFHRQRFEHGAGSTYLLAWLDDEPAIGLYLALGYRRHSNVRPVDEWEWTDDHGVVHPVADACEYWTIDL